MKSHNLRTLAKELQADMPGRGQPSLPAILRTLGALGRMLRRREQLPLIMSLFRKAGKAQAPRKPEPILQADTPAAPATEARAA